MKITLPLFVLLGLISFGAAAAPVALGNDTSFEDASVALPNAGVGVGIEPDVTASALPVPELSTAVLMLGGVGAVAFLALRRRGWRERSSLRRAGPWSRS